MQLISSSSVSFVFAALILSSLSTGQNQRPAFLTPTQMPAPINVAGASSYSMALSADGLRAMVETDRAGGHGGRDLFLLQRPTTQSSFTSYGPMGFCTDNDEGGGVWGDPHVYYHSNRAGGLGGFDVQGGPDQGAYPLNSPWDDTDPSLTSDGLEIFFTSNRPCSVAGRNLWRSTRATTSSPWAVPVVMGSLDGSSKDVAYCHEQSPSISDDGLWLFFASNRNGNFDIYVVGRATRQSAFGTPVRVAELSGPNHDIGIELAPHDAQALVTVMVNDRAVILSAARGGSLSTAPSTTELAASAGVGPGDILSATLRSPAGHFGIVLLGAPMAPLPLPIGVLRVDPASLLVLDAGMMSADRARLVQMLLPADARLHRLPIALQALSGRLPELRLTNAAVLIVQ